MKKGWLIALSISNIALACALGYVFYCERRSTGLLKAIKKDAGAAVVVRPEYKDYWNSLQAA